MATFVVGDIQGCYDALRRVLDQAEFDPPRDTLWVAGDLVNRGPHNIDVLRFIKSLGPDTRIVLGNHDIHLLAVAAEARRSGRKDTLEDVLQAPDREELLDWLRQQPLVHLQDQYVLSHAGLPHIWSAAEAQGYSSEVSELLRAPNYKRLMPLLFGNEPDRWRADLEGYDRLRVIVNYLTRMRFVGAAGELDFVTKNGSDKPPLGKRPWYDYPRRAEDEGLTFLFGHWASLEGYTGSDRFIALDTGCVWGGKLTLMRLDTGQKVQAKA